jgi:hypothetical protein
VDKPKKITARDAAAGIQLCGSMALAHDKLIAKALREINATVRTATVCNNNLRSRRSVTQMLKKWAYERRLIKDRDNN